MAPKLPWFPFYVGVWMTDSDVLELTGEQMGAYLWLLCLQWQHGFLPYEVHRVIPMVPRNIPEAAVTHVFLKFFPPDPDTNERRNPKLASIREKQLATYEVRAASIAEARKSRHHKGVSGDQTGDQSGDVADSIFISSQSGSPKEMVTRGGLGGRLERQLRDGLAPHPEAIELLDLVLLGLPTPARRFAFVSSVRALGPDGANQAGDWVDVAIGMRQAVKGSPGQAPNDNYLASCVRNAKQTRLASPNGRSEPGRPLRQADLDPTASPR